MIYPLKLLRGNNFDVDVFFYNPNIYPQREYHARRQEVVKYAQEANVILDAPEYVPQEFVSAVEHDVGKPQRCLACWRMRLVKTAQEAKSKGAQYFSTTLLVSPYQDQEALKKIGHDVGQEAGIAFYYEDFRPGFRQAHNEAHAKGIYCQKYCGCAYSEKERNIKNKY
ncbi:MAG: epoxyqueuosine reductase QueH [Candidatus Omnitrophica bacterium]|nr:epoxyqueuosine reductase QueH [Candidatus Omnitrophota bacterium]